MNNKRLEKINELLEKYYNTDCFEQTDLAIELIQGHVGWLINQVKKLDEFTYVNDAGELKITTKEPMISLMEFEVLKKENEKLKKFK